MSQMLRNTRLSLGLNNIKVLTQDCECEFTIAFVSLCCLYGNKKRSVQMKIYSKSSLMRCLDNKLSGYGIVHPPTQQIEYSPLFEYTSTQRSDVTFIYCG